MNYKEVMDFLENKGSEQSRKIYSNHGAPENMYGVKVADMKVVQKKVKINHELANELYASKNADAQYLAGLIADPKAFSKEEFKQWADAATWYMVTEYALAWNLAESPLCMEIALEWIEDDDAKLQQCAWAAMAAYLGITSNEEIDNGKHEELLNRIKNEIHEAENRVRYTMNGYVIALGGAIPELTEACKTAGDEIGKVQVSMGNTACKVPTIRQYIEKMEDRNRIGKKKKQAKC